MSFLFGGSDKPAPATVQTLSQTSEFPSEIKPFISDVLEKAKAQQEGREFEKFEGPRVAGFTPEQEQAFQGISGIAGAGLGAYPDLASSAFYATQAQKAAEEGLRGFDIDEAQRLIDPFQQAVTDVEKREAIRQFEGTTLPQIGSQAAGSGGFGGSRQAILEAEAQRNLQQQLGDIQARGLRDAYQTAARQFEAERGRQQAGAGQFGQFAQAFPGQALKELGAVQAVGETKEAKDQRALDIALSDFLTEQEFPTRQLQEYQSLIRGFPITPNIFRQDVTSVPSVPLSQQLLGAAGTGVGLAGAFGAFRKSGGQIQGGGLSSLERHANNVIDPLYAVLGPKPVGRTNPAGLRRWLQAKDRIDSLRSQRVPDAQIVEIVQTEISPENIVGEFDVRSRGNVPRQEEYTSQREAEDMVLSKTAGEPVVKKDVTILSEPTVEGGISSMVRRPIQLARPGSLSGFEGLLSRQAAEHEAITSGLEEAKKKYFLESPETKKLRGMIETRASGLEGKYKSDKELAKEEYARSLYRALAAGGIELMSQRDPGAGGLLGQVGAAAKRSGAIESLGEAAKTKADKIEALEERKDDLELKYAEVSAQLADAPKEKKFAYEKALADLRVDLADSRSNLASAIAEAGIVDVVGTAVPALELLTHVREKSGFSETKLHSDHQRKFVRAANRRRADYRNSMGWGATHDRNEEKIEMQRLISDAMQKIKDYAMEKKKGNVTEVLKSLTEDHIYNLGTIDDLTVEKILSGTNSGGEITETEQTSVIESNDSPNSLDVPAITDNTIDEELDRQLKDY